MHSKYYEKIQEIFQINSKSAFVNELKNRGFCFSEFQKKKLLFVGINPSYLKDSVNDSHSYSVNDAVNNYKKHYGKFQDLVNKTKYENDWTYIDLFFFRETDQNKVYDIIDTDVDFIIQQLNITHEIINEINPEIVVVCNSGASNFFGINNVDSKNNIWLGYDFKFDDNFGVEVVKSINKKSILITQDKEQKVIGTPFLFSSTLTYLDNFNKKRLKWIIERVGNNISKIKEV